MICNNSYRANPSTKGPDGGLGWLDELLWRREKGLGLTDEAYKAGHWLLATGGKYWISCRLEWVGEWPKGRKGVPFKSVLGSSGQPFRSSRVFGTPLVTTGIHLESVFNSIVAYCVMWCVTWCGFSHHVAGCMGWLFTLVFEYFWNFLALPSGSSSY